MRSVKRGAVALKVLTATAVLAAVPVGFGSSVAAAQQATGSAIVSTTIVNDRNVEFLVHSAAMDRDFVINVQRAADNSAPRPTLYLLNGAGGGEDIATWQHNTNVMDFLADKNVNVVQPIGGKFSYYTDWRNPDPVMGVVKWKTFLTQELPPLIDAELGTNGRNAIAGVSMSATSVLQLAIAAPGLFRSVASYSGCAQISDPVGNKMAVAVMTGGGGMSTNMYGPKDDPMWAANDPYVHADELRGTHLFISSATGMPAQHDTIDSPFLIRPGLAALTDQVVAGGALEAAANWCTHNLRDRLNELGIPATYDLDFPGSHSWGYFEDSFKKSWPVLAEGLGLPA